MSTIKVGVIGVGHLGTAHVKKYQIIEDADLVGFWDTDENVRQMTASGLGCDPAESLDDLLDRADAVSVVVPTTEHLDVCRLAAEKSIHVMVEKPIAASLEEADEIIDLCEKAGTVLQVGHIERFNSAFRNLKKDLLDPMFIESHRLAQFNSRGLDVSVILDLMIHDIDLILSFVKSDVTKIDTSGVGVISDNYDIVNARLTFDNGAVANVTASRISQKMMRKMRIFQKNSYISLDFAKGESEIYKLADKGEHFHDETIFPVMQLHHHELEKTVGFKKVVNDEQDSLELELRSFIHSVQNNEPPKVSGEDGRKALAIALEVFEKTQGAGLSS